MSRDYHRPVKLPTEILDGLMGGSDPDLTFRLTHETSWALLDRVRHQADPDTVQRVLEHARGDGLSDIAELWAHAHPHSLAGALWRLYVIRRAVAEHPEETAYLFRCGSERSRTIDPVIAGASEPVTPKSISELAETILRGAFTGDFADAMDRAWGFCRVMAAGCVAVADERDACDSAADTESLTQRGYRYTRFAEDLHAIASRWRDGSLD